MTDRPRALIIGGSVGGLMAASLLHRIGWDVAVFEKSPGDLAGRGAGLGLSRELFEVMRRVGVELHPSSGVAVSSLLWLNQAGAVVARMPRPWITGAWSRIYRPLRAVVPDGVIRPGRNVERVEEDGSGVALHFSDGTREAGDLAIAADGVHSTARRQFLPGVEPRYAGYIAWRGMVEESSLTEEARDFLGDSITFTFPDGEMTLSTPIPGFEDDTRSGHRRYYYIWYRPQDAARGMMTDEAGRDHFPAVPPTAIRPDVIAAMKEDAARVLPPVLADIVARTAQPLLQAVTDLEVPQLVFGRAALLGDAAFIARPHVAAGITKAALDAVSLADALEAEGEVAAALARYQRERLGFGSALVDYSRVLGAASLAPAATRDPARVMREYGAPHLLRHASAGDLAAAFQDKS